MKNYFPFTDYDFYAYLTSGTLMLAVIDFAFNDASFLTYENWNFAQIVAAVTAAYVTGHIIATFAPLFVETFATSKLISKPITLQLGYETPNFIERLIGLLVGRYYGPFETSIQQQIIARAREKLELESKEKPSAEDVLQVGFRSSFSSENTRFRIDSFLNQYGFCRNIAFVALLATLIFAGKSFCSDFPLGIQLVTGSFIVFIGMFVRFVKFLSSFQAEVIRMLLK